ncbi:bifunctional phosphoglucose/phosphomannose isomerase [bacterium]|nr:MAG: bifunctional phosphoglucose/phosphomannose isomerase [bacterium]
MSKGLNLKNIQRLDKSGMLDLLLSFPAQCKEASQIAPFANILFEKRDFSKIVFAGLGGSAIGADLVKAYLYFESKIPISVYREYDLPAFVDSATLVIISSYSGNTEETVSAYLEAKEKGATVIVISSGGRVKEYAQKDKFTFIQIPAGLPPRCALGYLSIIPLCLLAKLGFIKDVSHSLVQAIATLEDLKKKRLDPGIAQKENLAKFVASRLYNKFTVIYSSSVNFDVCATRFKGQLNENSKVLALSHLFPEMNHNEIVGWQNPQKLFKNFVVVMLRDKRVHPRITKRMDITCQILKDEGVEVIEIYSQGQGLLSRIFSLIYIGDFTSLYLAILYGIDPTPVDRVTYLKQELAKS